MKNQESNRRMKFAGIGAALGLVFGGLVGLLIGNPMVFAGGGMVLGLAVGSAFDQR
ncbi:MAG: hypothetical protein ACK2T7_12550 [Anaerolineales bacterium]